MSIPSLQKTSSTMESQPLKCVELDEIEIADVRSDGLEQPNNEFADVRSEGYEQPNMNDLNDLFASLNLRSKSE